jgi:hypothetical protein
MKLDCDMDLLINGMPFINDEDVIGKWEFYDLIGSQDRYDFTRSRSKIRNKGFREIYFLPNGQRYWIFEGWTKGFLFTHGGGDEPVICNSYTIEKVNDDMYMFVKVDGDGSTGSESYINVLKKVSGKKYVLSEIGVRDNIDLPFIMDESIIGLWKTIDVVQNIDDFIMNVPKMNIFWLKSICFIENGTAIREYGDEKWYDFWTKGLLISMEMITASAYEIRIINNEEYLFVEWKMGNYVYGGAVQEYHVFKRSKI